MLMADVVVSSTPTAFVQKAMDAVAAGQMATTEPGQITEAIMGFFINPTSTGSHSVALPHHTGSAT
jgi:hypothetical protein